MQTKHTVIRLKILICPIFCALVLQVKRQVCKKSNVLLKYSTLRINFLKKIVLGRQQKTNVKVLGKVLGFGSV